MFKRVFGLVASFLLLLGFGAIMLGGNATRDLGQTEDTPTILISLPPEELFEDETV